MTFFVAGVGDRQVASCSQIGNQYFLGHRFKEKVQNLLSRYLTKWCRMAVMDWIQYIYSVFDSFYLTSPAMIQFLLQFSTEKLSFLCQQLCCDAGEFSKNADRRT